MIIRPTGQKVIRFVFGCAVALSVGACSTSPPKMASLNERAAIEQALMSDISVLASDEFAGRRPGTIGETKTLDYVQNALTIAGFESGTNDPANPWRAPVALINTQADESDVAIRIGKTTTVLSPDSAIALTSAKLGLVDEADMVFVGRLGEDVSPETALGQVVVMLGEPGKSPPRRAGLLEKGAAAVITVVEDSASIESVRESYSVDRFVLLGDTDDTLTAFVTNDAMAKAIGTEAWKMLRDSADQDGFEPLPMPGKALVRATSKRREVTSHNLIGRLPGTNPQSGVVLLMAHWDHFGECGQQGDEDRLCNGAVDNASGVAAMLELARRLAKAGPHDRDIYVMGTTAEEWGLLGAKAFVENPAIPLDTIVGAFNYDTVAVSPQGSSFAFVGEGLTALDDIVLTTLGDLRLSLGNQILAEQFLRRQDSWALLEAGVPSVTLSTNLGSQATLDAFLADRYHQASDNIAGLELGGAIDDVLLHQLLLQRVASTTQYPASRE